MTRPTELIIQHRDSVATLVGVDCPIPSSAYRSGHVSMDGGRRLGRFRRISSTLQFPRGKASVMESIGHGGAHYVIAQELDLEVRD
jgi:hypothetical protein